MGFSIEYPKCIHKIKTEWQTMLTLGLHCLPRSVCFKTLNITVLLMISVSISAYYIAGARPKENWNTRPPSFSKWSRSTKAKSRQEVNICSLCNHSDYKNVLHFNHIYVGLFYSFENVNNLPFLCKCALLRILSYIKFIPYSFCT